MKLKFRIFLNTLLTVTPFLATAQGSYTIKGQVGRLNKPAMAYLLTNNDGKVKADSTTILNGKFEFKGSVVSITDAVIRIRHNATGVTMGTNSSDGKAFLLGNENIELTAKDSISKAVITGSALNDEVLKVDEYLRPIYAKYKLLEAEFSAKPEATKQDKAYLQTLEERAKVIADEIITAKLKYVKENPNQYMALMALNSTLAPGFDAIAMEKVFDGINQNLRNSFLGKKVAARIATTKKTQEGVEAADFAQPDANGKMVKLSDYRGKYVLLDFWASWCAPCRRENPNLIKEYALYKSKGFEILGVSMDKPTDKDKWLKAIADDKLTWTQVGDMKGWDNEAGRLYEVTAIPMNFLIDPSGKIVAKDLRGQALTDKLKSIFEGQSK